MRAAAGRIQLDVPAGAAPGHSVVGKGQAAGAVRIGISQRQPAVKGQREVARRSGSQVKADVHGLLCTVRQGHSGPAAGSLLRAERLHQGTSFFKSRCRAFINRYLAIILGSLCEGAVRGAD